MLFFNNILISALLVNMKHYIGNNDKKTETGLYQQKSILVSHKCLQLVPLRIGLLVGDTVIESIIGP